MNQVKLLTRKSNKYIYAQLVDGVSGKTLGSVRHANPETAGVEIAKIATKQKITTVIFDRGKNRYHGQVKKLADSARANGLKF